MRRPLERPAPRRAAAALALCTPGVGPRLYAVWAAGALVAKQSILDPAVRTTLSVGAFAWSLVDEVGGVELRRVEGATDELEGAATEGGGTVVDAEGRARAEPLRLLLVGAARSWTVGVTALPRADVERLSAELEFHLRRVGKVRSLM